MLSNLVRNAATSFGSNGEVGHARSTAENGTASVEVRDNVQGMEPKRLATLFEPTFRVEGGRVAITTASLFITRSIVSEHRGNLEIESTPGRVTTARVSRHLAP